MCVFVCVCVFFLGGGAREAVICVGRGGPVEAVCGSSSVLQFQHKIFCSLRAVLLARNCPPNIGNYNLKKSLKWHRTLALKLYLVCVYQVAIFKTTASSRKLKLVCLYTWTRFQCAPN